MEQSNEEREMEWILAGFLSAFGLGFMSGMSFRQARHARQISDLSGQLVRFRVKEPVEAFRRTDAESRDEFERGSV